MQPSAAQECVGRLEVDPMRDSSQLERFWQAATAARHLEYVGVIIRNRAARPLACRGLLLLSSSSVAGTGHTSPEQNWG